MRLGTGLLVLTLGLWTYYADAQEAESSGEFKLEARDLDNLQAKRISSNEAVKLIKGLVFTLFASFAVIVLLKLYWFKSDVEDNSVRTVVKRANQKGQGADIDPYRGIGNDPV